MTPPSALFTCQEILSLDTGLFFTIYLFIQQIFTEGHYTFWKLFFTGDTIIFKNSWSYGFYMVKWKCWSFNCVQLFETPWTVAHQTPLPVEFSRQGYWTGLPFPAPGDTPDPGLGDWTQVSLQADSLPFEPPGKLALIYFTWYIFF